MEWGELREGPIPRVTVGAGPTGVFWGEAVSGAGQGAQLLATGPEEGEGRGEQSRVRAGSPATFSRAWRLSWRQQLGRVRRPRACSGACPLEGGGQAGAVGVEDRWENGRSSD